MVTAQWLYDILRASLYRKRMLHIDLGHAWEDQELKVQEAIQIVIENLADEIPVAMTMDVENWVLSKMAKDKRQKLYENLHKLGHRIYR
jgi:hypothetical protein